MYPTPNAVVVVTAAVAYKADSSGCTTKPKTGAETAELMTTS